MYYNKLARFELVPGVLDLIMSVLEVPWNSDQDDNGYHLRPLQGIFLIFLKTFICCFLYIYKFILLKVIAYKLILLDPTFFPNRCGEVVAYGKVIGTIGTLHPDVIAKFGLTMPCTSLEVNIEPFL